MLLIQNGINPRGVTSLFKMLQKDEKDYRNFIPEYISTHPYTKNRIENIEKIIREQSFVEKKKPELKRLFRELKS